MNAPSTQSGQPDTIKRIPPKAVLGFGLYMLFTPAVFFLAAGSLNWTMGWVYVGLNLVSILGSRAIVWKKDPDLLAERAKFTEAEDIQPWDRGLSLFVGLVGPLLMLVVAGLDHRFGWDPSIPLSAQIAAAVLVTGGYALAIWAMVANKYFSAVARIQKDRGQEVVSDGPYAFIRHPGYAGGLLSYLATPFMLDALWALLTGLLLVAALVVRTRLEDRMLLAELHGYEAYSLKVRYRLIPGLW